MTLKDLFSEFMNKYEKEYELAWKDEKFKRPFADIVRNDIPNTIEANIDINKYVVKGTVGTGRWSAVPWIAIFNKSITKTAQKGVYIVYLLNKETKELYLTLNQGTTEIREKAKIIKKEQGRKETIDQITESLLLSRAQEIRDIIGISDTTPENKIQSGSKDYDPGCIISICYTANKLPDDNQLLKDLNIFIGYYDTYVDSINKKKKPAGGSTINITETKMTNKEIVDYINNFIQSKGFSFSENLIGNYYLSLKSKPFVILAGISGTGKTKLVELFAKAVVGEDNYKDQFLLVPVRPDWSDSSDLLGHMDLYNKYVPGAIIEFIIKANANLDKPYFLCLDEMNLARVEYYLSDVLSIIETREKKPDGHISSQLILSKELYSNEESAAKKYGGAHLSENLYIIGTVNMDETTFPFSKKVLDRANTIEFSEVDSLIPDFTKMKTAKSAIKADKVFDNSFLKSKYINISDCESKEAVLNKYCAVLQDINDILKTANAHVGYRVRDEITFYMLYNEEDGLMSEEEAMDNAIMQKILPRIQGNGSDIRKLTDDLLEYCKNHNYVNSVKKLSAMSERCGEYGEGYTSYWL